MFIMRNTKCWYCWT